MLLVVTVGPPVASLIIMTASCFPYCAVPLLSLYLPPANEADSP